MRWHLLQALRAEKQAAGRAALKAIKLAEKYSRKLEEEYRLVLSKLGMVSIFLTAVADACINCSADADSSPYFQVKPTAVN